MSNEDLKRYLAACRAADQAERENPTWPPLLSLHEYPKRGPNGLRAVDVPLGTENGVTLTTVVAGDHFWTEARCRKIRSIREEKDE